MNQEHTMRLMDSVDFPGEYKLGGEELILNSQGESMISYADYAVAMIDEAEKPPGIFKSAFA